VLLYFLIIAGMLNHGTSGNPVDGPDPPGNSSVSVVHMHFYQNAVTLRQPGTTSDTLRSLSADPDTLRTVQPDTLLDQIARPIVRYKPPEFEKPPVFEISIDDSTLRWMHLLNMSEWYNLKRGVIPNRLGGMGRPDAMFFHGHSPVYQRIYFEEIPAGDPVTGLVNVNRLQFHHFSRIFEQTGFSHSETRYRLRRYHLIRPLTRINFEQGADGLMSTEGLVSMNLNHRTNLEMSLWNMSDDGYYPRADFSGLQSNVAVHHIYNSRVSFRAGLYYNSLQLEEPGGYQPEPMEIFPFDRFLASPNLLGARSSVRQTLLRSDVYYRTAEDKPVELMGGIFHQRFRRFYFSTTDSSFYRTMQFGSYLNWIKKTGLFSFTTNGRITANRVDPDRNRSLDTSYWTNMAIQFSGEAAVAGTAGITGTSGMEYRSDGYLTGNAGGGFRVKPASGIGMHLLVSAGTYAPTIQQLYWRNSLFSGNPELDPVLVQRADAGLSWNSTGGTGAGVRGYVSRLSGDIQMGADSMFTSVSAYILLGGEIYASWNSTNWEIDISSTVLRYESDSPVALNILLDGSGTRFRNRASIYRKGYLFDFAAYVKIGLHGILTPGAYRAATYNPALDWWNIAPDTSPLPAYYRVDLDVTARIRSIFLMLKYENLFDQLGQQGYFETPYYPMPGRRFRLGIRWVLRN
jgi:hypothetical protein